MKTTYRALAYVVAILVIVQAADLAFGFFGMGSWIENDNDLTKATLADNSSGVTGEIGLALHSIIGQFLVPLVALVLLALSFFAHIDRGVRWAALTFATVVVQVLLAFVSFGAPLVGVLHGANAFLLLWLAMAAGRAATHSMKATQPTTRASVPV